MLSLLDQFGEIDIYLFDQVLRGRILPGMRIFDAGCGGGRNLIYFLREGYQVYGADSDAAAIAYVRQLTAWLSPALPAQNFRVEPLEHLSFSPNFADVTISNAVLHFARNPNHFRDMLTGAWQTLAPGGLFFCRLASSIGMEDQVIALGEGRFLLPDGSERYLVNEEILLGLTADLGGNLADPIKTTIVQNQRCMTTWVIRK